MGNYRRRDYHSQYPAWRDTSSLKGKYIGIELEVNNESGYDATLAALPNVRRNQRRPLVEEDGSLNDYEGVEIIFPPYKYSQLKNHRSFFHTALAAMHKAGTQGMDGYGMHMNVNTGGWSEDKQCAFAVVIGSLPESFIRNIGGRRRERAGVAQWSEHVNTSTLYARIEPKIGRIECRFPESTLDSERVMTLVDFIAMVEKYAGQKKPQALLKKIVEDTIKPKPGRYGWEYSSKTRYDLVTEAFVYWLDAQSKKNPVAKKLLEVLERGYKDGNKQGGGGDSAASPAKSWCSNNPGNVGKAVAILADEDDEDYDDDYSDDDCNCSDCRAERRNAD